MKILWFSNGILSKTASTGSGSWLHAMRDLIVGEVELVNITIGKGNTIEVNKGNGVKEYILPKWKLENGVPAADKVTQIFHIIDREKPDIVHIWGIERYWALLFSRGYLKHDHVLLEMQGVAAGSSNAYFGGLTPIQCRSIKSLKSILFPKQRLANQYRLMVNSASFEAELLPHFHNIATQSDWTRDQISFMCSRETRYYKSLRPIRKEFYEAPKWQTPNNTAPVIYVSFSYHVPFKGAHILLKALSLLKQRYPMVELRIAGPIFYGQSFFRGMDYGKYLSKMVDELGLKDNIHFCGSLNAQKIVEEILQADVVVNPSFVESYSAAAAEALYIGAPTILAYAGAMVNFSNEKPVALYYSPIDYRSLAARLLTMFENGVVREELIRNALEVMPQMCAPEKVKERQLMIYSKIVK